MKHLLVLLTALVAIALLDPTAAAAQDPTISAAVQRGDIELASRADSRTGVQWGIATAIVDTTPEVVMRIVTDYARYVEFLPRFEASRVLSRRGNNALVYLQASAVTRANTVWAQLRIFARRPRGQTQIIEGRMMEGNVTHMDARWDVTPIDGGARTLVSFHFLIDLSLFPDSIISDENRSISRRTLEALRRRVTEPRFRVARN